MNEKDAILSCEAFFGDLSRVGEVLRKSYDAKKESFVRAGADQPLREALETLPALFPQWAGPLETYDSARMGPLLGVSDEGSAAKTIADAAYLSPKARASRQPDAMTVGIAIDGERMTSSGEVPIGPMEYKAIVAEAFARTYCTTNVGVRANARLQQPFPELPLTEAVASQQLFLDNVFARFRPYIETPDGKPRPLTVRLHMKPWTPQELIVAVVQGIEAGRSAGRLGPRDVHRLSLLIAFEGEIAERSVEEIRRVLRIASRLGVPDVAIDGEVLEGARRRLSVQSLLNILDVSTLRSLLAEAKKLDVRLVYRYQVDVASTVRTIWTGLHTARTFGLSAAKYGLVPLALEEQVRVVELVTEWTKGWTAIPAFYVDTPLVTDGDVLDDTSCAEAATIWMERIRGAGARIALVDSPDRIVPRRLVRETADDRGVLTLDEIWGLMDHAKKLDLKVLWSGGISVRQAHALATHGAFGIFTTSSTASPIAVGPVLAGDDQLPFENEPMLEGVRRVHSLIQAGFLEGVLGESDELGRRIKSRREGLLEAIRISGDMPAALEALDETLIEAWKRRFAEA